MKIRLLMLLLAAAVLQACSTPYQVNARIWELDKACNRQAMGTCQQPYFPEWYDVTYKVDKLLDENHAPRKDMFGIVFSGGGTRSASASLGQLRVLNELNWFQHADYVSAISGGSWAVVPFMFNHKVDNATFLGRYLPPAMMNDETLKSPQDSLAFSRSIARAEVARHLSDAWSNARGDEAYAHILGEIFLKPYGLYTNDNTLPADVLPGEDDRQINQQHDLFTWSQDTRQHILASNKQTSHLHASVKHNLIHPVNDHAAPFPVIGGTLMVNRSASAFDFYPLEMTPAYVGVRQKHSYQRDYTRYDAQGYPEEKQLETSIGGSYIEPLGYDSLVPTYLDQLTTPYVTLQLEHEDNAFTLADMIATSGAAPQATLHKIKSLQFLTTNLGFPEFYYWAVDDLKDNKKRRQRRYYERNEELRTVEYAHGDGGHLDNIGIMPLLARQVKNILVLVNTQDAFRYDELSGEYHIYDNMMSFFDLPGRYSTYKAIFEHYPHNVVFEAGKFAELVKEFASIRRDYRNKPLVHCDSYAVKDNPYWDIRAYRANICWVYLDRNEHWIASLDRAPLLKKQIQQFREDYNHFPHYWTFLESGISLDRVIDYSEPMVNALAGIAGWSIMEARDCIEQNLLRKRKAVTACTHGWPKSH